MNHPCSQIAGNQTIERLQHIFASFNQAYGGLTLDLHCNRFGPTALFQVLVIPWGFKVEIIESIISCFATCIVFKGAIMKSFFTS
jgi:hypothetical protein